MITDTEDSAKRDESLFYKLAIAIVLLLVGYGLAVWCLSASAEAAGQFGDSFGAANALFSALAFAAVFVALRLQRLELQEQRRELRETRRYIADQAKTLALQRFETTFFSMLGNYVESRNSFRESDRIGQNAIQTNIEGLRGKLVNVLGLTNRNARLTGSPEEKEKFCRVIMEHLSGDDGAIVQLVRQISSMHEFIRKAGLTRDESVVYGRIISHSISLGELWLVFFAAQLDGFQELTENLQYLGFLENLPSREVEKLQPVNRLGSGAFRTR